MRYHVLACDYDGTLAAGGRVSGTTLSALERVLESGRKLVLVTGRRLDDLLKVFTRSDLFDRIVAENGAVLYDPKQQRETLLTEPPSKKLLAALRERKVRPLEVGKAIVATWQPQETAVLEAVRETRLELQVSFNKGAVMVLPSGINKRSGLRAALQELGLSPHNAIGIGNAENDHAFLSSCECSVAVANALDEVKEGVDIVTKADHGKGVEELIAELVGNDLQNCRRRLRRHQILLGHDPCGHAIHLCPYRSRLLVAGSSGAGKSNVVTAILERLAKCDYQFCVIDPEGDYEGLQEAVCLGDSSRVPLSDEVLQLLAKYDNAVVDLLGVPMADRPTMFGELLLKILEFQQRTGRPHWLVLDEAHHLLPASWFPASGPSPEEFGSEILVTVHPEQVSRAALLPINVIIAVGNAAGRILEAFSGAVGQKAPPAVEVSPDSGEVLVWFRKRAAVPIRVRIEPAEAERRRHRRKYAEGDLREKSFYFRGPEGRLNLQAQNLTLFVHLAMGVDDETWLYHLKRGDYSDWARTAIKDENLAQQLERIERADLSPAESRMSIKNAVESLYTGHA